MTTIHERIESAGIVATVKPHPGPAPEGFLPGTQSWRVTLRYPARGTSLTVPFHTGPGWDREPTAADVLDCLLSNAATYNNATSFEDFCREFGYDENSRKTERLYLSMGREADRLEVFIGDDFQDWCYETERL